MRADAAELAATASNGVIVARSDGRSGDELRSSRGPCGTAGASVVVLGGATPEGNASLAAATDGSVDAASIVRSAPSLIGGGGGGSSEGLAGGKTPGGIDAALDAVKAELGAT